MSDESEQAPPERTQPEPDIQTPPNTVSMDWVQNGLRDRPEILLGEDGPTQNVKD
jgi:hypothetical protein